MMFEKARTKGFQILALYHAEAILRHDMSTAANELEAVLMDISIPVSEWSFPYRLFLRRIWETSRENRCLSHQIPTFGL